MRFPSGKLFLELHEASRAAKINGKIFFASDIILSLS
jgi:hypothetical protein